MKKEKNEKSLEGGGGDISHMTLSLCLPLCLALRNEEKASYKAIKSPHLTSRTITSTLYGIVLLVAPTLYVLFP